MTTTQLPLVRPDGGNPVLQAYEILQSALRGGAFPTNGRLPSERELAEQLAVSRATVRQVLTALARTGLVRAVANRGWYVATSWSEGPNILRSFTETVREQGFIPTTAVLSQRRRAATLEEAERLRVAPATPIVELERLRGMDGVPLGVDFACLPLALVPDLDTVDLTDRSLLEVLSERYGLVAARCDYEVQAQGASARIAELLRLETGGPVLVGAETTYDQSERPIMCGHTTHRGDAYRFQASLFRF